jgi:hypothetical protein
MAGGQIMQERIQAPSASMFQSTSDAAVAQMRAHGAGMTSVTRESGTNAMVIGVMGGSQQTRSFTASNADDLEAQINAAKAEIGAAAPFVEVVRQTPFLFTVTRFAQLLTLYYFLFFLVILPLLGLLEKPSQVPESIAKPVLGQTQGAS